MPAAAAIATIAAATYLRCWRKEHHVADWSDWSPARFSALTGLEHLPYCWRGMCSQVRLAPQRRSRRIMLAGQGSHSQLRMQLPARAGLAMAPAAPVPVHSRGPAPRAPRRRAAGRLASRPNAHAMNSQSDRSKGQMCNNLQRVAFN